jgi:hypothetical protein
MNSWTLKTLAAASILLAAPAARAQAAGPAAPAEPPAAQPPAAAPAPEPSPAPAPAPAPTPPAKPKTPVTSAKNFDMTFYGFAQFDAMHDSTQGFQDTVLLNKIPRSSSFAGQRGRTQFNLRNTRIGMNFSAPEWNGIKATGNIETDFSGNQGNPAYPPGAAQPNGGVSTTQYANTEQNWYGSTGLRVRLAWVKVATDIVDIQAGQQYFLFGLSPYFLPATDAFLSVPGNPFGRGLQFLVSKTISSDDFGLDIIVGALRPPARDGEAPDGEGAVRVWFPKWKGLGSHGGGQASAQAMQIGASGMYRHLTFSPFSNAGLTPNTGRNTENGYGINGDLWVPIVPGTAEDLSNALTLYGQFSMGTAIADMFAGLNGNYTWPTLPNSTMGGMPANVPYTTSLIDSGLVTYDLSGVSHTIDWMGYIAGLQYALPVENGKLFRISANYGHMESANLKDLAPKNFAGAYDKIDYVDANLFIGLGGAAQFNLSWQGTFQKFLDAGNEVNHRFELSAAYFF